MRFCDLFIRYKIGLKGIRSTIPVTKLPLYRKVFGALILGLVLLCLIFLLLGAKSLSCIFIALDIILVFAFLIVDSLKRNLKTMLEEHYVPYSEKRMNMVLDVLKEYRIDAHNVKELDMLIDEARYAQIQCDYLAPLKKPIKVLYAMVVPIIAFVAQKIGDSSTREAMIMMASEAIALMVFVTAFLVLLTPMLKQLIYIDYNRYDGFISDIRQVKLFYAEKDYTDVVNDG